MRRVVSSVTVALGLLGATVALAGVARAAPAPGSSGPPADAPARSGARSPTSACGSCPGWSRPRAATSSSTTAPRTRHASGSSSSTPSARSRRTGPVRGQGRSTPRISPSPRTARPSGSPTSVTTRREGAPRARRALVDAGHGAKAADAAPDRVPGGQAARRRGVAHRRRRKTADHHEGDQRQGRDLHADGGAAERRHRAGADAKVGEITLPKTQTENPLNTFGRIAITGAARSPDGSRVVLRTYADAFEWDVTGGDIVGALTTGKPRVTALADPFGEAISYTPDGKSFLTVSDAVRFARTSPSTSSATRRPPRPRCHRRGGRRQAGRATSWAAGWASTTSPTWSARSG